MKKIIGKLSNRYYLWKIARTLQALLKHSNGAYWKLTSVRGADYVLTVVLIRGGVVIGESQEWSMAGRKGKTLHPTLRDVYLHEIPRITERVAQGEFPPSNIIITEVRGVDGVRWRH